MASRITFKSPKEYLASAFDLLVLAINQRLDELAAASTTTAAAQDLDITTLTLSGTVADLAVGKASDIAITITANTTLTGMSAGNDGQLRIIRVRGYGTLTLAYQSSNSLVGNRFWNVVGGNNPVAAGALAMLMYSRTLQSWIVIGSSAAEIL